VRNKKYITVHFLLFTVHFLLFTSYFFGCAPRVTPPPLYKDIDLSLEEIILITSKDINVLKAIVGVDIERYNEPYTYIDASVLIKRPGLVHIRTYRFGVLVGDYIIKDRAVYVLSGRGGDVLKKFGREIYHSIFWWDGLKEAFMHREAKEYVIRSEDKEIHLDRATLLPIKQKIKIDSKSIDIMYEEPQRGEDFWYPSVIKIDAGTYRINIKVKKLIKNPSLGESDFKLPLKS